MLRDTASVSGINPFFSLSSGQWDQLAGLFQNIGISKTFLADALTINAPELIGGSLALTASLILGKKADASLLSNLSGAYVVSSLATANPLMLPIAASGMVYSICKAENKKAALLNGGKGALVSGGALLAGTLVGGPVWLSSIAAVGTAITLRYMMNNPEKAFLKVQEILKPAQRAVRKMTLHSFEYRETI